MIPKGIVELMDKCDLALVVVASLRTGACDMESGGRALPMTDLIRDLFGDIQAVQSLNASLQGQIMPTIWSQGDVSCYVCKPTDDIVVGAFATNKRDAAADYWRSKKVDEELAALWNNQ